MKNAWMIRTACTVCLFTGFGVSSGCSGETGSSGPVRFDVEEGVDIDATDADELDRRDTDVETTTDSEICNCGANEVCREGRCLVETGASCSASGDCAAGSCREFGDQKICATNCDDSCEDSDLVCHDGTCLPRDFCGDADGDMYGKGPACEGADCDDDDSSVFEGAKEVCNGVDDDCNGKTDELEKCECSPNDTRPCYEGSAATRGRGVCEEGQQTCKQNHQWGPCKNQVLPGADICDGKDNDCDGGTDENLKCQCTPGKTRPCYTGPSGTKGVGRCAAGTQKCLNDHTWGSCNGDAKPASEQCDGKDNDCDGGTDENFNLKTDPRNCGSCGSVCSTPNASAACSGGKCRIGKCHQNYWDLDGKVSNGCEYNCTARGAEACNGIDDNCDGRTDEGFGVGTGCTGTGTCGPGAYECLNPRKAVCSTNPRGSNSQANPETCDGKDNDCDGSVDEDFTSLGKNCTSGTGQCETKGVLVCSPNGKSTRCGASPSTPQSEICDGKDNDCDGRTDEPCKLADTSWPTFKHDVRRTAHNMNVDGPNNGKKLWSVSVGSAGRMSPVVGSSGAVYVGGGKQLYKVRPNGKVKWKLKLAGPASRPTLQSDGAVYIGGGRTFYAVAPDGNVRWKTKTSGRVRASIIADNGDVYVSSGAKLLAFRPHGRKMWEFNGASRLYAPTIGLNGNIYTSATAQVVYSVDTAGRLDGRFARQGADTDGGPSVGQSGVVYAPFGQRVFALSRDLSTVRWNTATGGDIDSSISIMNTGFKCCNPLDFPHVSPNGNSGLVKLDDGGNQRWRYSMSKNGSGNGAPIFDRDGDAYVGDSNGTLHAVDRSGSSKWSLKLSSSDIWAGAIAKGRVYVVSGGTLYAVGK